MKGDYFNIKKLSSRPKRSISMQLLNNNNNNNNNITNYELIQIYHNEIYKLPHIIINKNKTTSSYEVFNYLSSLESLNTKINNKINTIYDLETKNNLMNIQNDLNIIIKHITKSLL
jgi:hypothetical protein